jgi:hypothetical protein
MDTYVVRVSAEAQAQALHHLSLFFFKHNVPLHLVESPSLKAAFAALGLKLPCRQTLSTTLLDKEFAAVQTTTKETIDEQALVQLASDGWRRRSAAGGNPLINFMLLLALGGSLFYSVTNAVGEKKDKHFVAKLHLDKLREVTDGKMEKALGVVMDNTKTNRAAMKDMKAAHPHLITLGCAVRVHAYQCTAHALCGSTVTYVQLTLAMPLLFVVLCLHAQAHSLDLLLKDLSGANKGMQITWAIKVYSIVKMMSLVINGNDTVRAALHEQQRQRYDNVKGVDAHCPTRFSCLHFISKQLQESKEAIKDVTIADNWDEIFKFCENKDRFRAAALETGARGHGVYKFWQELERIIEVVQPVCDAIHQLEADKPRLSQVKFDSVCARMARRRAHAPSVATCARATSVCACTHYRRSTALDMPAPLL